MRICDYVYLGLIHFSLYRFSSFLKNTNVWFTKKREREQIPFSKGTGTDNSIILSSWSCLVWFAAKLAHCDTQRLLPDEDVPS